MSEPQPSTRLAHQPALDGLRAVAVTMVLLFHGGVSWMGGGYFGVSVFFTLSGFLITSLLVREFDERRRIAPGAFYMRRAKRLLPASTVCLAVVSIMASRDVWRGADHIRRDALGALFQVANWVQLAGGGSYTDLQSKKAGLISPLDHYWSLAIEEQFYWIWPLAFWALAALARRRGWSLTRVMLGLTLVFAAAAPLIAVAWGRDAAYWATPARAAEILIGALLAVALREGRISPSRWMAPVGFIAICVIAVVLPAAGGPAYHGAFPLLALASGGLLLGLQIPGPVTTALSWRPFVALGAVSYGVYLFHFPVYVFLSAGRVGRDGWMLLAVRLLVTLAVALASYWLIERPIRRATWTGARTAMNAAVAVGLVVVAIAIVPTRNANYWTVSAAAVAAAEIPTDGTVGELVAVPASTSTTVAPTTTVAAASATPDTSDSPTTDSPTTAPVVTTTTVDLSTFVPVLPPLSRPVRIIVVGDSTAEAAGAGLIQWAAQNPTIAKVTVLATPGCGFIRGGVVPTDADATYTNDCNAALDVALPHALAHQHPDVVMLMTSIRDIEPRIFDPQVGKLTPHDTEFVTRARADYETITDTILFSSGAQVAWVRPPPIDPYWLGTHTVYTDPVAHEIVEGLMTDVAADHPDRVSVLDLGAWMVTTGIADDHDSRPDGEHLAPAAALDVANRWLGPELVLTALRAAAG